MISLILYNWEVRDEYLKNFEVVSNDELVKDRQAGIGSILKTFLHIIDVEYSWIRAIFNKPDLPLDFDRYNDLQSISILSSQLREEIKGYLNHWKYEDVEDKIYPSWMHESYSKEEIFKHLLVHEVHHIGQLSLWARELGVTPASSSFIGRNLINREISM
ncbi:DinB family protein [Paenibacillus endoradicis]|uniref:DinB family protein n=1 Tax=Paenibacillus endoradicis TaxID=2972487 RepID=UPI002158ABB0|nr:DinB family protein [Paenibacillus endoradicis]MCR8656412.1 DinB family protein [Paenibacillus endoradicis]